VSKQVSAIATRAARLVDLALERVPNKGSLAGDVSRLSRLFTTERGARVGGYMNDPALRAAYLAYFTPLNAMKVAHLVARLVDEGSLRLPERPRVLDLGAGPLSATLGVALVTGALGPSSAVDRSRATLEAGRELARAVVDDADITLQAGEVHALPSRALGGPFDLVIIANALNEMADARRGSDARLAVVRHALALAGQSGAVLLVEPASRVHARALGALRDELVAQHGDVVRAPCPFVARCPMGLTRGDWCFADLPFTPPPAFIALEARAGLRTPVLQASHLLLGPPPPVDERRGGARIVSGPMRSDDVTRRYLCTHRGLRTGIASTSGDPLSRAARGAWLPVVDDTRVVDERRATGARGGKERGGAGRPRRRR